MLEVAGEITTVVQGI